VLANNVQIELDGRQGRLQGRGRERPLLFDTQDVICPSRKDTDSPQQPVHELPMVSHRSPNTKTCAGLTGLRRADVFGNRAWSRDHANQGQTVPKLAATPRAFRDHAWQPWANRLSTPSIKEELPLHHVGGTIAGKTSPGHHTSSGDSDLPDGPSLLVSRNSIRGARLRTPGKTTVGSDV